MSRSRNSCYTCRVRKKKCDEQQPSCGGCKSSNLQCCGYDVAPPDWMQGKRNWREVMATPEARELQSTAGAQYKARRRREGKALATSSSCPEASAVIIARNPTLESIWWDDALCASLPTNSRNTPNDEACLLKLYFDFIFPIQFSFYPMSTPADHSWLMSGLCGNTARYHAALSISASFRASLTESDKTDQLGLNSDVAQRQIAATTALQPIITGFSQRDFQQSTRDVAATGLVILEVMHQLISLEVFSMLEGAWQLHHQATRTLLNAMHSYRGGDQGEEHQSPIDLGLADSSRPDMQRSFEFHLTCVAWIDIIASATYGGFPPDNQPGFDYIPYLHRDALKTQRVMGCHSSTMASIAEISRLADWKTSQVRNHSLDTDELFRRGDALATRLRDQVLRLEHDTEELGLAKIEEESRLVTLQFACAAELYLHVVVHGGSPSDAEVLQLVARNLTMLEALPAGLVIRANWPFTVTGCLASEATHRRFRGLVTRLRAQGRPLGMIWKGLMVIEECWRLGRSLRPELREECDFPWRMGMQSLGKMILLV